MGIIKLIRKLFKSLNGTSTRRSLFLGVFLGLAIGIIPGFNLTSLLFIVALLFLNCSMGIGAVSILIGKILRMLLAPVLYYIGVGVMNVGFKFIVKFTANTPVLALLDWEIYAVVGALVLIIIAIIPLAWLISARLMVLQEKLGKIGETDKKWVKILLAILGGKQKEFKGDPNAWFDVKRCRSASIVLVIFILISLFISNFALRKGLEQSLGTANGAEVNISAAKLSLLTGNMILKNLQLTDPENTANNTVQADKLKFDLSMKSLLTKSFVIDQVICSSMLLDAARKSPGQLITAKGEEPKEKKEGGLLSGLGGVDTGKAMDTGKKIKKLHNVLKRLTSSQGEKEEKAEKDTGAAEAFLKRKAEDLVAERPLWVIREAKAEKVKIADDMFVNIELANLSSSPGLLEGKPSIKVKPDSGTVDNLKKRASDSMKDAVSDPSSAADKLKKLF